MPVQRETKNVNFLAPYPWLKFFVLWTFSRCPGSTLKIWRQSPTRSRVVSEQTDRHTELPYIDMYLCMYVCVSMYVCMSVYVGIYMCYSFSQVDFICKIIHYHNSNVIVVVWRVVGFSRRPCISDVLSLRCQQDGPCDCSSVSSHNDLPEGSSAHRLRAWKSCLGKVALLSCTRWFLPVWLSVAQLESGLVSVVWTSNCDPLVTLILCALRSQESGFY